MHGETNKMVMKVWKKTRSDKLRQVWLNEKNNKIVSVQYQQEEGQPKYENDYVVYIGNKNETVETTKFFKTKSQALAFAKKYMRSH